MAKVAAVSDELEENKTPKTLAESFFEITTAADESTRYVERVDTAITSVISSPGMYNLVWASKELCMRQLFVLALTIAIQLFLPLYLVVDGKKTLQKAEALKDSTATSVRIVTFLLTCFLASTFTATMDRVNGMVMMTDIMRSSPYNWIHHLGAFILYTCILLTACATFILFVSSPQISQILLNTCALNFIPDVDVAMTGLLKILQSRSLKTALTRLEKLGQLWPTSQEREKLQKYAAKPINERFQENKGFVCHRLLHMTFCLCLLGIACLNAIYI